MSFWTSLRDAVQSVASVAGNYFLPGSSLITSQLVSKGAQEHLGSPLGQVAQIGSGVSGGMAGNMSNYGNIWDSMTGAPGAEQLSGPGMESGGGVPGGVSGGAPGMLNQVGDWASNLFSSASPWTTDASGFSTLASEAGGGAAAGGGIFSNASSWIGPMMSIGSGLYGMSQADKLRKQAMLAGQTASPWTSGVTTPGSGQALAQTQLMDVMKGGSAYQNTPAFQARMQAALRTAAAQGGSGGGAEAVAAANAGGAGYMDYVNQMAGLAGAPGSPAGAAQISLQGQGMANSLASSSLGSIGYGVTQATGGGTNIPPAVRQWLTQQGLVT